MIPRAEPIEPRVLLIPGGASTVHGYFPELKTSIGTRAAAIEFDPPGIGTTSDGRPLKVSEYAHALAEAVRRDGDGPVIVVAHSLGGLVALRLAIDEPDLVAGLLLLDPTPLTPRALLTFTATFLKVVAALGLGRCLWTGRAHRDLRGVSMTAEQAQSLAVYTDPHFFAETARWARYLARDGTTLASDIAAGKLGNVPTVVISADEHSPKSADRRGHEQLVALIPDAELQVWDNTSHAMHIQRPNEVAETVLALLDHA